MYSFNIDSLTEVVSSFLSSLKSGIIVIIIEKPDELYRKPNGRKKLYIIHDYRYRTLITTTGTITFKHTYYKQRKEKNLPNYYSYISHILEIDSYARMTLETHSAIINCAF